MLDLHPGVDVVVGQVQAAEGWEMCVCESTGGVDVVVAEGEFFEVGEERGDGAGGGGGRRGGGGEASEGLKIVVSEVEDA